MTRRETDVATAFASRSDSTGWRRLQRLTGELVGQDDEAAILRAALLDIPEELGCRRVEVWLAPAPHRPALHATTVPGRGEPVAVRPVERLSAAPEPDTVTVPLTGADSRLGELRLVGCPRRKRRERARLAIGLAHLLSVSLGAAHAVGQVRRVAQESSRRAHQDGLTSLGNRRLLEEWGDHLLALAAARSRTSAVLLFDVDGFKQINDTLGHGVGDRVLAEIGRRIRGSVRGDDLAVRLGGDEFAVLSDDLNTPAAAEDLAARLLAAISEPMKMDDVDLRIRSSVGIAVHGEDGSSTAALLQVADQAMYASKARGSGLWHRFTPSPGQTDADVDRLLGDVADGLLGGQLELHYQPQVDLRSGHVTGFEALARWRHPDAGLLNAADFMPLVERAGRTRQLTSLVVDRALAELRRLEATVPGVSLSVNVSPRDLIGQTLVPELDRALSRHGIEPARLVVEITEPTSSSLESQPFADLANLGCPVSIGEYGTGQSSLTTLAQHEAIREVKVNAALISQLPDAPARRLVRAIVTAAHSLGVKVTAEGVESDVVAQQVRELGCDAVQGNHYHAPAPADQVAAWVRDFLPSTA